MCKEICNIFVAILANNIMNLFRILSEYHCVKETINENGIYDVLG